MQELKGACAGWDAVRQGHLPQAPHASGCSLALGPSLAMLPVCGHVLAHLQLPDHGLPALARRAGLAWDLLMTGWWLHAVPSGLMTLHSICPALPSHTCSLPCRQLDPRCAVHSALACALPRLDKGQGLALCPAGGEAWRGLVPAGRRPAGSGNPGHRPESHPQAQAPDECCTPCSMMLGRVCASPRLGLAPRLEPADAAVHARPFCTCQQLYPRSRSHRLQQQQSAHMPGLAPPAPWLGMVPTVMPSLAQLPHHEMRNQAGSRG